MRCERCGVNFVLYDSYDDASVCVACGHVQGTEIRPRLKGTYPLYGERKYRPKKLEALPGGFKVAARGRGRPRGGHR